MTQSKKILIIAGPNGAGKTTFAREFLIDEAQVPTFINADLIAVGLNPLDPERVAVRAGRLMLRMIRDMVDRVESFAFETTLSGRGFARMIPEWQERGYQVELHFFRLASADRAVERVAQRVLEGGHHVPEDVIRRRVIAGLRNFQEVYREIVDEWRLYDSTGWPPIEIEWGTNTKPTEGQQMEISDRGEKFGTPEWRTVRRPGEWYLTDEDLEVLSKMYPTPEQLETMSSADLAIFALRRAAIKARRRAIVAQGYVATWRDGKMYRDTEVYPD